MRLHFVQSASVYTHLILVLQLPDTVAEMSLCWKCTFGVDVVRQCDAMEFNSEMHPISASGAGAKQRRGGIH